MSTRKKESLTRQIVFGLATAAICIGTAASPVYAEAPAANALPTAGSVASGTANITQSQTETAGTMNISQTTDKAVINWGTFNVGSGATVNFIQPSVSAITLNRVASTGGMSQIYGNINANGSIILINPNGMLFANGSSVNAAGIIASTADITDTNFNAGKLIFKQNKDQNANITMSGTMNAETNGSYITGAMKDSVSSSLATQIADETKRNSIINTLQLKPATSFSVANNKIMLVADGDIAVGNTGKLTADTTTNLASTGTVGSESFTVGGTGSSRESSIVLRADQNADDVANFDADVLTAGGLDAAAQGNITRYDKTSRDVTGTTGQYKTAKVYLQNDKANLVSQNVGIYYDPDITSAGINGTAVGDIGVSGSAAARFTQKNYNESQSYAAHVADTPTIKANTAGEAANDQTVSSPVYRRTYAMLVNNVYQLQAIQDTEAIKGETAENMGADTNYYGNLGGSYALGTTIMAADTANWNEVSGTKLGFNPIGSATNVFSGAFSGNGGSDTYGIYDLNIKRSAEDNVGLFAKATGSIWSTSVIDSTIVGQDNVGGLAGATSEATISGSTVRKRNGDDSDGGATKTSGADNVKGANQVGGLVGKMAGGSIQDGSYNASQVTGTGTDTGGLVGQMSGGKITDSRNIGHIGTVAAGTDITAGVGVITGATNVGGLVGSMNNGSIGVVTSQAGTYNNGAVTGTTNVGGLVGDMSGSESQITQAYNTNEKSTLGTTSIVAAAKVGAGTSP